MSLVIPRLELQDQTVLECGATKHRAEKKKPCDLSCLWRCCGCRKGGMSDCQPTWRGVQGTPGWGCGWRFLGIWAWFAARLVLYFGYAAALTQPPMPQQPVCPWKVLWTQKWDGVNYLRTFGEKIWSNKPKYNIVRGNQYLYCTFHT